MTRRRGFGCRDVAEGGAELGAEDLFRFLVFALGEEFAEANDRRDAVVDGGFELEIDALVAFVEVEALLGVAEEDVAAAERDEHGG